MCDMKTEKPIDDGSCDLCGVHTATHKSMVPNRDDPQRVCDTCQRYIDEASEEE